MSRSIFLALPAALAAFFALGAADPGVASADPFSYMPPGTLVDGSGKGRIDDHVYAPGIRFPIEQGPAFANSQVWGHGGSEGPGGGQCDVENYSYPWWDNYCETRTWDMPLCPAGTGHQGQDIRPGTCEKDVHWAVAVTDGTITSIGSYTVYLTAADGTRYDYLHMSNVQVAVGDEVVRGQPLGKVSNVFGNTPTTFHLHFNIKQNVDGVGTVFVPTYLSLIQAYQKLITAPPQGSLLSATCDWVEGNAADPDTFETPTPLTFSVDPDTEAALTFGVTSDVPNCDYVFCLTGFRALLPIRLHDGKSHVLHVAAPDTWSPDAEPVALDGSPKTIDCPAFSPEGYVKRRIAGGTSYDAWGFDSFIDELPLDTDILQDLPDAAGWAREPDLVTDRAKSGLWIVDGQHRRAIAPDAVLAFHLDPADAKTLEDDEVLAAPEGPAWPARPIVVVGRANEKYILEPGEALLDFPDLWPDGQDETTQLSCTCTWVATEGAGAAPTVWALAAIAVALRARRRSPRPRG